MPDTVREDQKVFLDFRWEIKGVFVDSLLVLYRVHYSLESLPLWSTTHMRLQIAKWIILLRLGVLTVSILPIRVAAIGYRADLVPYNLNTNQNAQSVLEYDSSRPNITYTPSPTNWRSLPFYTVLLDKFADGDPSNNDFFATSVENDWRETGFRYGGDLKGLQNKLDYLYGMGIRGIFIAGSIFLNMPWQADGP
jgi:alpha-1,3-glucan synthase